MSSEMVRVYDTVSKEIITIPAAELSSAMIRAKVAGIEGEVYIEASTLKAGREFRHPPFDEEKQQVMRELSATFEEVYPRTAKEWEDGFRYDMHPNREIHMWCCMAQAFQHFTEDGSQSKEQKQETFHLILSCVNNTPKRALQTTALRMLARPRAKAIVAYMEQRMTSESPG